MLAFPKKLVVTLGRSIGRSIDEFGKNPRSNEITILDQTISAPNPVEAKNLIGKSLISLGFISLAFLGQLTLLSQSHYTSSQIKALNDFRFQLANGTAPVGQVDGAGKLLSEGTPVALIEAEAINLRAVVLEGTSGSNLMDGPGHKRDTVLPGQRGISVIYGRQAAYSGVFGSISSLKPGDKIEVTTGQGKSTYLVSKLRRAGDQVTNDLGSAAGRLTLVTAEGIPFIPNAVLRVEAELVGQAKSTPSRNVPFGAIATSEQAMAGDLDALSPAIFLAQALILVLIGFIWLRRNWGKTQAWLVGVPALAWLGSHFFEQVIRLLPNLI